MNKNQNRTYWVLGLIATVLVLSVTILVIRPVSSFTNLAISQGSIGHDPLTSEEIDQAIATAIENFKGDERFEILLSERHVETKNARSSGEWRRRSDVYVYSYDRNVLKLFIIDLETLSIDSVDEEQNIQLPLTPNEIREALEIAYANQEFQIVLDQSYLDLTGETLTSLDQLNVKAFIFRSDSMPDNVNELARNCGVRRCAQLLFYTLDNIAINMQPIVDLSEGKVAQFIEPYSGDNGP